MLPHISSAHLRTFFISPCRNKVCSVLSLLSSLIHSQNYTVFPSSLIDSASISTSSDKVSNTHLKSPSANLSLVGKIVFLKYSSLLNKKDDKFCVSSASVNELLLRISHVSPETARKHLRVCSWEPENLYEFLLDFELGCRKSGFDSETIECLWEIFRRVDGNNEGFKHLLKSFEVMASMLINMEMFREVEYLLSMAERQGILLASGDIFSGLIEGYVSAGELERALLVYDMIKGRRLVLSLSCYRSIIGVLMKKLKAECVISVYEDAVEAGFEFGDDETRNLETLIGFLCWDGKMMEARKLLRKIVANGWKPSRMILSEVANVYCEKRDFEDLLNFFSEMKCAPDILVGNRVIHLLCSHFGIDRADSFLWELEQLGFRPNEITLGIFICFCCRDGKLRDAFCYLADIFTRGFKPDRHSYNALISSIFKVGMTEHALDILNDMIDNGIKPDLATFRALLAGYCKARKFDEVKFFINTMTNCGLVLLSPSEDPLSKAFSVLGLDPLSVKVKRDNDLKNFRAEFVDDLGNGLYLDTNVDEFEKTVIGVLEESLVPDFNFLVARLSDYQNVKEAVLKIDEMTQWGQELSPPVLSAFVRLLSDSNCHVESMPGELDNFSQLFSRLDDETLNLLIQTLCKIGFTEKGRLLFDEMHRRHLPITSETYNYMLFSLCKLGNLTDFFYYLDLSWKETWLLDWRNFVYVLEYLCHKRMLKELLELFDIMVTSYPDSRLRISEVFLQKLCSAGFTSVADILFKELSQNSELDHKVYSHLIKGYCEEKCFSEALMIFDTFLGNNLPLSSDAILTLVPHLCKANRFKQAVALKDTCLRDHPSISCSIYSALISGFCMAEKITEADDMIREMSSKNFLPSDEVYSTLLNRHCRSSDLKTTKELLCFMIRRRISLPLSSYGDFLHLLCRKGMFHSAWGLKKLMLLEHNSSSSSIYNIIIFYLFQTGNHARVDELLDELNDSGLQLDEVGHSFLVHGYSSCKDVQRSIGYLNDMIIKGLKPSNRSLRAVIWYLCRNGQVQNALDLSYQIELRGWNLCTTVRYALLEGLLCNERILEAERFGARILEKRLISDPIIFDNLIRKFGRYGRLETAVNLLNQILKTGSVPETSSYECIVQRFCDYNNLNRAMEFLTEMLHRKLKPNLDTWDLITEKFCMQRHATEAEGLLNSMVSVGQTPTKRMYSSVIDKYSLENNMTKASELLHRMQQHGYDPDFTTQWSLISSLSNSGDRQGSHQGFLSRLLGGSGFFTEGLTKSRRR